ncbi:MAG TPA: hypothetical protein VH301_08485, partial [Usitatibacter sp.]|nr:hypothetical protein [Usitatibacter sp.]
MSLFLVAVMLVLIVGAIIAFTGLFGHKRVTAQSADTAAHLAAAQFALEQYAGASGNLPCPANPALDTGDADPIGPTPTCNSPAGTVPWRTIGLSRDQAFDAWGWKISYRVYTGAAGSLTQANAASMVQCTTNAASWSPGLGAGNTCRELNGRHTKDSEYLATRALMLKVTDFGAPTKNDVAYVLISHGVSGLGAWTSAGVQKMPLPANAHELSNENATDFFAEAASDPSVDATNPTHFDDVIVYRELLDFIVHANLAARAWPDPAPGLADVVANSATVAA